MIKRKTYTLYAVQHKNEQGQYLLIGLYKDKAKAQSFCDFLNDNTLRELGIYEVHNITTDLN